MTWPSFSKRQCGPAQGDPYDLSRTPTQLAEPAAPRRHACIVGAAPGPRMGALGQCAGAGAGSCSSSSASTPSTTPTQVLGGQRQRIGIARAMALPPKLGRHEPAPSLDVLHPGACRHLLQDGASASSTSPSSSSPTTSRWLSALLPRGSRVMYLGKIVEIAAVIALNHSAHPYTQGTACPRCRRQARGRDRGRASGSAHRRRTQPVDTPSGCRFLTRASWRRHSLAARLPRSDRPPAQVGLPFPGELATIRPSLSRTMFAEDGAPSDSASRLWMSTAGGLQRALARPWRPLMCVPGVTRQPVQEVSCGPGDSSDDSQGPRRLCKEIRRPPSVPPLRPARLNRLATCREAWVT